MIHGLAVFISNVYSIMHLSDMYIAIYEHWGTQYLRVSMDTRIRKIMTVYITLKGQNMRTSIFSQ